MGIIEMVMKGKIAAFTQLLVLAVVFVCGNSFFAARLRSHLLTWK